MLASLLPGIRELRAPLVSGYTIVLAVYLIAHSFFPNSTQARVDLEPFYDLFDFIGRAGSGIAISVAAYPLGASR